MSTNDTRIRVTLEDRAGDDLVINSDGSINVNNTGGTGASATQVQGTAATDAAVVGNPVYIGGKASNAQPTAMSGDGDVVPLWLTRSGAAVMGAMGATGSDGAGNTALAIVQGTAGTGNLLWGVSSVYNGSTWDRMRGDTNGLYVRGFSTNPTANFTRPSDTTAYASGDLVANSTTAGSVTAMSFTASRFAAGSFMIRRAKIHKSGTGVTNASFRLHLYLSAPTAANGDNGAFSTDGVANYLGSFDVTVDRAFTDGAAGFGIPTAGSEHTIKLASGSTIVGLLEARAAYTPGNAEVFTVTLDVIQD